MLKYAALLAMSLTLLACDEPGSSLPDAGDVSFRPGGGGIRYSCTHLGSHNLEQLEHQGTTYTKVKHLDATTVMVVGEGASKVLKAYELIGDEMAIHGRFGEADVIADVVVVDVDYQTKPFSAVLEMVEPIFEICGEEDGVLIIAKAGDCPDDE